MLCVPPEGSTIDKRLGARLAWIGLSLFWLTLVGTGLIMLWSYAETPGPLANAAPRWPVATRIERDRTRPTLMLFTHPHCACSRATLGELAVMMAHVQHRVSVHVLFYRPASTDIAWQHTDLWDAAKAIPGVDVESDVDGQEAAKFGASVSGQTLLYDQDGRLAFNGGITFARGHFGDNAGRTAITEILLTGRSRTRQTPVFGCFLVDRPVSPDRGSQSGAAHASGI
jgi:hypothetical protein